MDTPLPRWPIRTLLLAWSIPAVLGVPFAIGSLRTAPSGLAPWRVLVVVAVTWQIWTLLTVPVLALADQVPLERPWRVRAVAAHVAASLATCAAQALATAIVFRWLVDPASSALARAGGRARDVAPRRLCGHPAAARAADASLSPAGPDIVMLIVALVMVILD